MPVPMPNLTAEAEAACWAEARAGQVSVWQPSGES